MSFSTIKITIRSTTSVNDYTRLLKVLDESEVVEDICYNVD